MLSYANFSRYAKMTPKSTFFLTFVAKITQNAFYAKFSALNVKPSSYLRYNLGHKRQWYTVNRTHSLYMVCVPYIKCKKEPSPPVASTVNHVVRKKYQNVKNSSKIETNS